MSEMNSLTAMLRFDVTIESYGISIERAYLLGTEKRKRQLGQKILKSINVFAKAAVKIG